MSVATVPRSSGWLPWEVRRKPVSCEAQRPSESPLESVPSDETIRVYVTGYQWWWDIEYDLGTPATRFTSANEIVIP